MEDISSFGPSSVIAVGLDDAQAEQLQEECSARRYRLVVAARQSDLPLSPQCDFAIVGALLPDGDGRKLTADFVRAGARVALIDNVGSVPLFDAWTLGATVHDPKDTPADWLDGLAAADQVEAVSRAGRLMEALRLADSVESAASFSGASGVPVSFVRMRPHGSGRSSVDDMLDRLTSVVGVTTVFYDVPSGERVALVINGDRRRLAKLLDSPEFTSDADITVLEVSPEDDLGSVIGRSLLNLKKLSGGEERPRVLLALGQGQDRTTETIRLSLHRLDFSTLFRDAAFEFEEARPNQPLLFIVDLRQAENDPIEMIEEALAQSPPIPVLVISDDPSSDVVRVALEAGASDFLVWPFQPGEAQAAIARVIAVGAEMIKMRPPRTSEPEIEAIDESARDIEPADEPEVSSEAEPESEPEAAPASDIEAVFAAVLGEHLAAGEQVTLDGLGVLSVHHETSRIVHDKRGRTIVEPPRRALSFTQEESSASDASSD